jgi:hypothetical protein
MKNVAAIRGKNLIFRFGERDGTCGAGALR